MDNELYYVNDIGHTVFTSKFLKNRGTCCKSACLHCPFGYTLKKCGLQFREYTQNDAELIQGILSDAGQPAFDWAPFPPEHIRFIEIKGTTCGFILKNHIVVKHFFLKKPFLNQGLSKELIESYFFI
jgi:hypothetical protein